MKVATHIAEFHTCAKSRESRVLTAALRQLKPTFGNAFLYEQERWAGLPIRIAYLYAGDKDKASNAIQGRLTM